jgi:hypothetical protein
LSLSRSKKGTIETILKGYLDGISLSLISQPSLMTKTFLALAIFVCALATPFDNAVQLILRGAVPVNGIDYE